MPNIQAPSVRYDLTSDLSDSITGDSGTIATNRGGFTSHGFYGEIDLPLSFSEALNWGTGDGTLSMWTTLNGAMPNGNRYLINDRQQVTSAAWESFSGGSFDQIIRFFSYNGTAAGPSFTITEASPFGSTSAGTPIHVALVKDSSQGTVKLFINGSLEDEYNWPSSLRWGRTDTQVWRIGGFNGNMNYSWDGRIADISAWDGVVLSDSDISEIYSAGQGGSFSVSGLNGLSNPEVFASNGLNHLFLSYDDNQGGYNIYSSQTPTDSVGAPTFLGAKVRGKIESIEFIGPNTAIVNEGGGDELQVITSPFPTPVKSATKSLNLANTDIARMKWSSLDSALYVATIDHSNDSSKLYKVTSENWTASTDDVSIVEVADLGSIHQSAQKPIDISLDKSGNIVVVSRGNSVGGAMANGLSIAVVNQSSGLVKRNSDMADTLKNLAPWDINCFENPDGTVTWYAADGAIPGPQTIISTNDITSWFI